MQIGRGGKLAIAELAPVRRGDDAVGDRERGGVNAEALAASSTRMRADLRAGEPQRRAAVLDRLAAGGQAFVGRPLGVARDHPHPVERQVEFLRGDLRQAR